MLDYDTNSRLQAARDHADCLGTDMRRSRSPKADQAGEAGRRRLGLTLAARVGRLRRRRHAPAYQV